MGNQFGCLILKHYKTEKNVFLVVVTDGNFFKTSLGYSNETQM